MGDFQTHEHDVLVIGAGGAGLRAAIGAAAVEGCSVGLVCKSLLGKAHTVMAEGGVAAAMANVDERDGWETHFADTMRGGQYLNNPKMAELHAKEAPARVHELEEWGALFDRTQDGRILQRNFGGHAYPRLAHVGDRTGLEMIRTLQDHGIHQGIEVYMECTVVELLKDGDRVVGAFGYDRERGRFRLFKAKSIVLATGGIGRAYKVTSNSWEYTGDGAAMAYEAGGERRFYDLLRSAHQLAPQTKPSPVLAQAQQVLNNEEQRARAKRNLALQTEAEQRMSRYQRNGQLQSLLAARAFLNRHPGNPALASHRKRLEQWCRRRFAEEMNTGEALYARGQYREAYRIWKQVAPLYPDDEELNKKLERSRRVLANLRNLKDD